MTKRVRALLVTPDGNLLTIRRERPGQSAYWVLPGGGTENGETLEAALARELREELAATADIHSLLHIIERDDERQYIYLARARTWCTSAADRTGPEFTDPARGKYHLEAVPLTASALSEITLKPDALASFLLGHLSKHADLFALPDLRAGRPAGHHLGQHETSGEPEPDLEAG